MMLKIDIPTPERCVSCMFGYADKLDEGWVYRCKVKPDLRMTPDDAFNKRHDHCPGKV